MYCLCKLIPLRPSHVIVCSNIHDVLADSDEAFYKEYLKDNMVTPDNLNRSFISRLKSCMRLLWPNIYTQLYSKKHFKRAISNQHEIYQKRD